MRDTQLQLEEGIRMEQAGSTLQALEWFQAIVDQADDPAAIAEALRLKSRVHRNRSEWTAALETARRSAEIAKSAQLPALFSEARNAEAAVHLSRGDFAAARTLLEEILRTAPDDRIRGIALQNLATAAAMRKDFERASDYLLESHACFQRAGYARGEAIVLNNRAALANDREDYELARDVADQAVTAAGAIHDFGLLALASLNQAKALIGLQQYARAEELASTAFGHFAIEGNTYRQIECLRLLGDLGLQQNARDNARRCYEYGLQLARQIDAPVEAEELARLLETLDA